MPADRNVLPADPCASHYALKLRPDFEAFTFAGTVAIDLKAEAACGTIVFNSTELTYAKATLSQEGKEIAAFAPADFVEDTKLERVSLTLPGGATFQGAAVLAVEYSGIMNDKMKGFYRAKYTVKGETAYMGTTQFEAVDARRALPCWDEPVHKASFDLTLEVAPHLTTLSNMPEKSRTAVDGGLEAVAFQRTPVMSTYLLAWTIAEFDCIETTIKKARSGEETLVRIFAAEGKVQEGGKFALEVAAKVLPMYEQFFGSDYLLPKVDLLAIPDFACGAMENWGMITYRETALLCDDTSSARHREWVALVVAHELAHQWFGNLVTMDWWKELWLNESFATWVEYWAVDRLFPEWQVFTQFVHDETGRALNLDGLRSSHPVEVPIFNAEEVDDIFDAISYSKGGSVLRMVVETIGLDAFSQGLIKYLDHFKFRNATTKDLWKFLGDAAGVDLTDILAEWIGAQGYPHLQAARPAPGTLTLEQHRFLSTGAVEPSEDETLWKIPLVVLAGRPDGTVEEVKLTMTGRTATVAVPEDATFIKVNARQAAFVRVGYTAELAAKLTAPIQTQAVSNVDRLGLIGDVLALAESGRASTKDAMELAMAYTGETDSTVWCAVAEVAGSVRRLLRDEDSEVKARVNAWVQRLFVPTGERLQFTPQPSDDHRSAQLRTLVLGYLVNAKYQPAVDACTTMWDARATTSIPADLRGVVYAAVIKARGKAAFDAVVAQHDDTLDAMEKARCLAALGQADDEALLKEALDLAMSDRTRAQDAYSVLIRVGSNSKGRRLFIDLVKAQWPQLWARFPGMLIGRTIKVAIEGWSDEAAAAEVEAFLATIDEKERATIDRSLKQGLEAVKVNATWRARDRDAILAAL